MGVEVATKVITSYLDPQAMEVAPRSDFGIFRYKDGWN